MRHIHAFRSAPFGPPIALRASAKSCALRASGPTTARSIGTPGDPSHGPGWKPAVLTSSSVGLSPYTPQKCAGMRIEPLRSLPTLRHPRPAARAAAPPPVDPPAVRVTSHGLFVAP